MHAQPDIDDRRYPRPPWFHFLRWVFIHWVSVLIIILVVYIVLDLGMLVVSKGPSALLSASLISSLLAPIAQHLPVSIPLLGIIVIVIPGIIVRLVAQKDRENEERIESARRQRLTEQEEARRQWQLVEQEARRQLLEEEKQPPPPGFNLIHILEGHLEEITRIAWSPDGHLLASGSFDHTIGLWDPQRGKPLHSLTGHSSRVFSVAWSPDGHLLASGSFDYTIGLWNPQRGKRLRSLTAHTGIVFSVAWSPDGHLLASGSDDHTIGLWDPQSSQRLRSLTGHTSSVLSVAWSPDGHLASGSSDATIRLWDPQSGKLLRRLEGHTDSIRYIDFSSDGRLLASKSADSTVRLWNTSTWQAVVLPEATASAYWVAGLAFHPTAHILATLGQEDRVIRLWKLDLDTIVRDTSTGPVVSYSNAKIVLVGDSGVGKSGLGLVLAGERFEATESTHGRRIWHFEQQEVVPEAGQVERHETLLWDLAGQPGYRLVHQLHLNEVAVALLVFDARSETDPFAGIEHWDRGLRQAQRLQGDAALPLKKFLVAARADRGGIGVGQQRIQTLMQELHFAGYFETSAKEGWQVAELRAALQQAIDWEAQPKVSSTALFQEIQAFLTAEKEAGRLLSTSEDLYRTFLRSRTEPTDLWAEFTTCIGRVEAAGLIKQLSFGNLVLLQPELLDAYASALVNAVKDEPDGLGSIAEERVRTGDFRMPTDERLADKRQEQLLLIAMMEDLLRHELALREEPFLVFPSQSTRENPDLPNPEGRTVVFTFEGSVLNLYATLAVRLSNSGIFKMKALWKNAIEYTANAGGTCGMFLRNAGEGRGELTLFFDERASEETRHNFEDYVQIHLQRRALSESIKRRRIFTCDGCGLLITDQAVELLAKRGSHMFDCPVCHKRTSLADREERLTEAPSPRVQAMDQAADQQRDQEAAKSTVEGKKVTKDFDVFLCYHRVDKQAVKQIGEQLKDRGYLPWLDEWELPPGRPWQRLLEEQIEHVKSAAVFVGKEGTSPWQRQEIDALLREFVDRECPVIPVLLPDAPQKPELPVFLRNFAWVDFREQEPEPMDQLIWGITGKRPWP